MSHERFPLAAALLDLYRTPSSTRLLRFVAHIELARMRRGIPTITT